MFQSNFIESENEFQFLFTQSNKCSFKSDEDVLILRSKFRDAHEIKIPTLEFSSHETELRYLKWYELAIIQKMQLVKKALLSASFILGGYLIHDAALHSQSNVEAAAWLIFCGLNFIALKLWQKYELFLNRPLVKSLFFLIVNVYVTVRIRAYEEIYTREAIVSVDMIRLMYNLSGNAWVIFVLGIILEIPFKLNSICMVLASIWHCYQVVRMVPGHLDTWVFDFCESKIMLLLCGYTLTLLKRKWFVTASKLQLETMLSKQKDDEAKENDVQKEGNMQRIIQVTHDIGGPLTVLQLSLDELWSDLVDQAPHSLLKTCTPYFKSMFYGIALLGLMRGNTQFATKVQMGMKPDPDLQAVNLYDLVDRKCRGILSFVGKETINFSFKVSEEISEYVITDQKWIWQMCMTLLHNANHHTESGEIELEVGLVPWKSDQKANGAPSYALKFTCRDSGSGVPLDLIPHLGKESCWTTPDGDVKTAMGLYVLEQKSRILGGYSGLESSNSEGSVFFFIVPYVKSSSPKSRKSARIIERQDSRPSYFSLDKNEFSFEKVLNTDFNEVSLGFVPSLKSSQIFNTVLGVPLDNDYDGAVGAKKTVPRLSVELFDSGDNIDSVKSLPSLKKEGSFSRIKSLSRENSDKLTSRTLSLSSRLTTARTQRYSARHTSPRRVYATSLFTNEDLENAHYRKENTSLGEYEGTTPMSPKQLENENSGRLAEASKVEHIKIVSEKKGSVFFRESPVETSPWSSVNPTPRSVSVMSPLGAPGYSPDHSSLQSMKQMPFRKPPLTPRFQLTMQDSSSIKHGNAVLDTKDPYQDDSGSHVNGPLNQYVRTDSVGMYKILVVDGQVAIRRLLGRSLQRTGLAVDTAKDGKEGLQMLESNQYTHLITDLDLPYLDGSEMITKYYERMPSRIKHIRICILTAGGCSPRNPDFVCYLNQQCDVYMDKPLMIAELLDWLDTFPPWI
mmetsp:Transcript_40558/g.53388  ORF Transcript_40558/g.53388 Transcript_40558/m.53388 type:complete len:960 (+) Transcript_40558:112-2991(+)